MSSGQAGDPMGAGGPATEEELRAAYEAEIKKIRVEQVLLEQVVTLVNLGMRRTGLAPGTEDERDLGQVRLAIDSIRALLPVIERSAAAQAGPIRDALSQLQLAYVRLGGAAEGGDTAPGTAASGASGGPGAATPTQPVPDASAPQPPAAPGQPGPVQPAAKPGEPEEGGPAQRSGRLWVPGQ
jgi:hypothetical protein